MPPTPTSTGGGIFKPLIVLAAAIGICVLVIWLGPYLAEAILSDEAGDAVAETVFTIVIFGGLLAFAILGARLSGVRALRMGPKPGTDTGIGLAIGVTGVLVAAGYGWLAGTLSQLPAGPSPSLLLWGTLLVLLQAGSEEVYFRGWLQPVLAERWGAAAGVIVAAIAFALLHVIGGARSPLTILNLFLGGTLFGLLTLYRGGIAAAVAGHFAWNWTEQMVLGLHPNPGVSSFGAMLDLELAGATVWGGSEEGLNASAAMTLALAALVVPLLLLAPTRPAATGPDRSGPAPA